MVQIDVTFVSVNAPGTHICWTEREGGAFCTIIDEQTTLKTDYFIAPEEFPEKSFFVFLHENKCYGYSLEVPHQGASNEYPQHMFLQKNKKNVYTFLMKNTHILELLYFL